MDDFVMPLMLGLDVQSLAMSLVNIESPHGDEGAIAASIEAALRGLAHLDVERIGNTVVASTHAGHDERVLVSARIDAPPSEEPPLAFVEMGKLFGPGASDAKGSVAVALKVAAHGTYLRDVTFVFHGGEASEGPALQADFALVATPTRSVVTGSDLEHPLARSLAVLTEEPATVLAEGASAGPWGALGTPFVAFGPGDPAVAGTDAEFVPTAELGQCEYVLRTWLTS